MGNLLALFRERRTSKSTNTTVDVQKAPVGRDAAEFEMKKARDRLEKFIKRAEYECTRLQERAKQLIGQDRKMDAKRILKLKRVKENAILQAREGTIKLDRLSTEIEMAQNRAELLNGLDQGTRSLESLNKQMPLEEVEKLLARTDEALTAGQQIDDLVNSTGLYGEPDALQVDQALEKLLLEVQPISTMTNTQAYSQSPATTTTISAPAGATSTTSSTALSYAEIASIMPDAPTHAPSQQAEQQRTNEQTIESNHPMPEPA